MDYKEKYEQGLECIQEILSSGQEKIKMTLLKERLLPFFPELKESEDEKIRKELIFYLGDMPEDTELRNGVTNRDVLVWLEKQDDKDKLIKELGKYKVKYTQEVLEKHINSISNKDNERLRKTTIAFLKDFADKGYENAVECIDWLEKQKVTDKEIVFRPLAGTDIIAAANQALEKIEIGKEVVLAFNGAYIPVNGKTVAEICNEYFAWHEKQGEEKSKDETKNAEETIDDWHKRQCTSVKTTAYGFFGKYGAVEYVYILDYSTGRVIVAKHNIDESISELFEQLGLKENQCHYMVSSDVLSIEYINF